MRKTRKRADGEKGRQGRGKTGKREDCRPNLAAINEWPFLSTRCADAVCRAIISLTWTTEFRRALGLESWRLQSAMTFELVVGTHRIEWIVFDSLLVLVSSVLVQAADLIDDCPTSLP